jgi:hypothetical protein
MRAGTVVLMFAVTAILAEIPAAAASCEAVA